MFDLHKEACIITLILLVKGILKTEVNMHRSIPKFDPKELKVVYEIPANPIMPGMKIYDYPVTPNENCKAAYLRKPYWQMLGNVETKTFTPRIPR